MRCRFHVKPYVLEIMHACRLKLARGGGAALFRTQASSWCGRSCPLSPFGSSGLPQNKLTQSHPSCCITYFTITLYWWLCFLTSSFRLFYSIDGRGFPFHYLSDPKLLFQSFCENGINVTVPHVTFQFHFSDSVNLLVSIIATMAWFLSEQ